MQEQTTATQDAGLKPAEPTPQPKKEKVKKPPNKKRRKRIIIWSIVLLLVVGYIGYSMWAVSNYIPTVKAGTISRQQIDTFLSTSATVQTSSSETYFAPPECKVLEVNFKVGDRVQAGDVIATFDLSDLNDQIRLAQIAVSDANIALKQAQNSLDQQQATDDINQQIAQLQESISNLQYKIRKAQRDSGDPQEDVERWNQRINANTQAISDLQAQLSAMPRADDAELNVTSARNSVEKASINLNSLLEYQDNNAMVAKEDGILTQLSLVEGAPAGNTSAAAVVESTSDLKAGFNIGKYDVGTIREGQKATLTLGDMSYEGTVTHIGSAAVQKTSGTSTTTTIPAEITIDNPDENLVVGLEFDVEIHTSSNPDALALPVEALLTDNQGDFCYRLIPSEQQGIYSYEKTYITVGNMSDSYAEILDGIEEGAMIVLSPPTTIDLLPLVQLDPSSGFSVPASQPQEASSSDASAA